MVWPARDGASDMRGHLSWCAEGKSMNRRKQAQTSSHPELGSREYLIAASHTTPLGRSPRRPGRRPCSTLLFRALPAVSDQGLSTSSGGRSTASAPPARAIRSRFGGKMEYDDLRRREDVTRKPQPAVQPRLRSRGRLLLFFLIALWVSPHARAKMNIDFDPDLDFSKFKTFAYIGGVEHLVMLQLNPNEIRDRVHEAVT